MPGTTDTVKAKLTPGEFVIRKEAVDMIGVPMLNKLNNMPEEGGHSAIDKIIDMATISNMKMMYGGGMVKPNYAGGGMVKDSLMGMRYGGMAKKKKMMGYEDGGEVGKLAKLLSMVTPKGRRQSAYEEMVPRDMLPLIEKASTLPEDFFYVPADEAGYIDLKEQERKNAIRRMLQGRPPQPQEAPDELIPFQEGGAVEEGIPLPPQPMDPLQIGARQADPSIYEGSTLGVRDQAMMLQNSIEQDTVNKARKTLQLMKLKGLLEGAESLDYQGPQMKQGSDEEMKRQMLQRMIMMRGMPF
jgi:hypothetical protein